MKLCMIGTGYVGLVSGVCFSDLGNDVICVDKDINKIKSLKMGKVPIYEPGLSELVIKNIKSNRLTFSTDLKKSIIRSDIIFICVGTPTKKNGSSADLNQIYSVAKELSSSINRFKIIITKSTVPVTTGDEIEKILRKKNNKNKFSVVSNPEFLREGEAIRDFTFPDRIVVGSNDQKSNRILKNLYGPLISKGAQYVHTSRRAAELIKYASNAFLAMKISFINEIADLCEKIGADVTDIAKGIGLDKRIGPHFLEPGPGFGGSCFPKDARALIESGKKFDAPQTLLESVILGNESRKKNISKKILEKLDGQTENQIGILGVTFKAETDDMREAPSLIIIPDLQDNGMNISVYDPEGEGEASKLIKNVVWKQTAYEAAEDVDCLVILTDWKEFKDLDLIKLKDKMKRPLIYDFRNIFDPDKMAELGFEYFSLGRG